MSRIEEALRKAQAEQAAGAASVTEPVTQTKATELDPETLAREPFPLEMPERRPTSGRKVAAVSARATVPAARPEARRDAKPPQPESLLQRIDHSLTEKVVVDQNISPTAREQYRRLAATFHHAQATRGLKVVLIGSAVQGEGKSLTATNLALTLSESYQKTVLLIDADLRRPTLHTSFHIDNRSGLSEGLTSREQHRLPVRQVSPKLSILPAGRPTADPMGAITSDRMRQVIEEARDAFDWIIIDSPPVVLLPDANLLGSMADASVLVVKAAATPYDLVNRALTALGRERILGVVLNRSEDLASAYAYYTGYYETLDDSSES
jgi:capsular exopolysaccharide synthesis family protein